MWTLRPSEVYMLYPPSKVYLLSTIGQRDVYRPYGRSDLNRLIRSADCDRIGRHYIVDDPAEADVIIFVRTRLKYHADIKRHMLVQKFKERCFVFDFQDNALPSLPGLYVGLSPRWMLSGWFRSGFYVRVADNGRIHPSPIDDNCKHLFWFRGRAANSPVRRNILSLKHPRALLQDHHSGQSDGDIEYFEQMKQTKFVLCPRGIGPSTWRLFETMAAGRVPVILSDDWIPPTGPAWDQFSLIVPERDYHSIPDICEMNEPRAAEMGVQARETFDGWFSLESSFHRVVEWCLDIKKTMSCKTYRMPGELMPLRTLNRTHLVPYWREYARTKLTDWGLR